MKKAWAENDAGSLPPRGKSNSITKRDNCDTLPRCGSFTGACEGTWHGLLTWPTECTTCPLLYFIDDSTKASDEIAESNKQSLTDLCEERRAMIETAKDLINKQNSGQALTVLLNLAKFAGYQLLVEEFKLLISSSEIVLRDHLLNIRKVRLQDSADSVKPNVKRASITSQEPVEENVSEEKLELRNLLFKLVDTIQSIRQQMTPESDLVATDSIVTLSDLESPSMESKCDNSSTVRTERFDFYLTFFSLVIQSAFLEAGLVTGKVFINRLLGNAEEAFYMVNKSADQRTKFLLPLAAYIYGRLWCEASEDEYHGADFLNKFCQTHKEDFDALEANPSGSGTHSTRACTLHRILQTLHRYKHLL